MEKLKSRTILNRNKERKYKTQEASINEFILDGRSALMSLDRGELMRLAKKHGINLPIREDSFQIMIHKIIVICDNIPDEYKEKSKKWLVSKGVG